MCTDGDRPLFSSLKMSHGSSLDLANWVANKLIDSSLNLYLVSMFVVVLGVGNHKRRLGEEHE